MNKSIILGNLTRDPETRQVGENQCTVLRVASSHRFVTRTGDSTEEVCYIDVNSWGRVGDACAKKLRKGSKVLVEGRLRFEEWQDPSTGQKRSRHTINAEHVHFLSSRTTNADTAVSALPTPTQYAVPPAMTGLQPAPLPPMPSAPPKTQPTPAAPPASAAPPPPPCALPAPAPAPVPASPPALPVQKGGE